MGRFVVRESGDIDFGYKFVFGEQSSNFGEILKYAHLEYASVTRYISDDENGEIVDLFVDDAIKLKEELTHLAQALSGYDKEMIEMFINAIPNEMQGHSARFFVEY